MKNIESEKQDSTKVKSEKPDDQLGLNMSGHVVIRDKETGTQLVNKRG
jgi:hypothetical protein